MLVFLFRRQVQCIYQCDVARYIARCIAPRCQIERLVHVPLYIESLQKSLNQPIEWQSVMISRTQITSWKVRMKVEFTSNSNDGVRIDHYEWHTRAVRHFHHASNALVESGESEYFLTWAMFWIGLQWRPVGTLIN